MNPLEQIFKKIMNASIYDLYRDDYLMDIMCEIGTVSPTRDDITRKHYEESGDAECVGESLMIQKRSEVLDFIKYIRNKSIRSYCEVGVGRGGLFILMTALLIRYNREFKKAVAVEPRDIDLDFIGSYCKIDYFCASTDLYESEKFDLCFIDGDHSYEWVKRDWESVGKKSGIAAFHDIKHETLPEVRRFWKEISLGLPSVEIVHAPFNMWGIGVVINKHFP